MWIPRSVELLIEKIDSSLNAIQKSLSEQKSAVEEASAAKQRSRNEERWQRFRRRITYSREQKRAKKECDSQLQKHERQLIGRQDTLNLLTALAVLGAWLYAGIAAYQLHEMRAQTDIATKNQAKAVQDAAAASSVTQQQLVIAQQQATAATNAVNQSIKDSAANAERVERQLGILKQQADTAQNALEVQNRPWLSVEVEKLTDNSVNNGGLGFDRDGNLSMSFTVKGKNFGRSVAQDIHIYAKLFATRAGDPWEEVPKWQGEVCDKPNVIYVRPGVPFFPGFDLFPDQPYSQGTGTNISNVDVIKASFYYSDDPQQHRYIERLYLVGCVDYRFSFGKERHQTRFAYDVIRAADLQAKDFLGMPLMSFEVGANVPKDMISMFRSVEGPNTAY